MQGAVEAPVAEPKLVGWPVTVARVGRKAPWCSLAAILAVAARRAQVFRAAVCTCTTPLAVAGVQGWCLAASVKPGRPSAAPELETVVARMAPIASCADELRSTRMRQKVGTPRWRPRSGLPRGGPGR